MNFRDHIAIDANVRFGKPCIKGTRIAVYEILGWLSEGMKSEEILEYFPELTETDIRPCLGYASEREHNFQNAS